ncbi:MAG: hypothetical protein AAB658_12875 [Chloroflexota bacterium]
MKNKKMTSSDFPGIAFATLPITGETIAIQYGAQIHYRVNTTKTTEELNAMYGVTPVQAQAVLERVLAGHETRCLPAKAG